MACRHINNFVKRLRNGLLRYSDGKRCFPSVNVHVLVNDVNDHVMAAIDLTFELKFLLISVKSMNNFQLR